MMNLPMMTKIGFARVNSILGTCAVQSQCPYVWDESAVFLMNARFDEVSFRYEKLNELFKKDLSLSFAEIETVYDAVVKEQKQLMTKITYALPGEESELLQELDFHIKVAITRAEHYVSLEISRENIQKARPLNDGWMTYDDVSAMVQLAQKRRFTVPEKGKFVNGHRH